uniref:CSON008817 protein n=1 Tax=Culicoides sonorensis TaxID=179676 RepID=A0A336KEV4_CULSO
MQRWWYADYNESPPTPSRSPTKQKKNPSGDRTWKFQVLVPKTLYKEEKVAVAGDCDTLGNWEPNDVLILNAPEDKENIWSIEVDLPSNKEIRYRYLICSVDPHTEEIHIRQWETHIEPRVVPSSASAPDVYGDITPLNLLATENTSANLEDSISNDTRDNPSDQPTYAFTEVTTLNSANCLFEPQEQFGRLYHPNNYLLINVTVSQPENVAYIVDLYTHSSKASVDEPPYHLGYHYIMPNILKKSDGQLELPITCATKHRPLGLMRVEFLKITPLEPGKCTLKQSFARYWSNSWTGLDVGHRGSGTSFKANSGNVIRENTIASLKKAAEHGADMVEFDVQLSKDLVPVIYHDFNVYVSLKKKGDINTQSDMLELPMRELTLKQLKELKVFHLSEGQSREQKFFDEHIEEHQPFPQLSEVLDRIDASVGFNIEIKWSQERVDGTHESQIIVDRNLYLDCILEVVLAKAGDRRIVFSCFDADICTMLRYKQNLYPVMFLTQGITSKYIKYREPRCSTIEYAVRNACCMELLGIVAHTEDLLRDASQINLAKEQGLVIFCWGDDNNCQDTIKYLKDLGIHGVIYDKMDVLSTKGIKEAVFEVGAGSAQSKILQQIDLEHSLSSPATALEQQNEDVLCPMATETTSVPLKEEKILNYDVNGQTFVLTTIQNDAKGASKIENGI